MSHIFDMTWMQVERYLQDDDRAVVPLGSTEQHAYLSLGVDNLLAGNVAREAAEPLGVPVFPTVNYGLTPYFMAYPGTLTLSVETYARVLGELLDGLAATGFRRVLMVNGHGGNAAASTALLEWRNAHPEVTVKWHDWWKAPRTWAQVQATDPEASHASWMENFPWTRLPHVPAPEGAKPMVDLGTMRLRDAAGVREMLGDGNMGGVYEKPDDVMQRIWDIGVAETREALEGPWS